MELFGHRENGERFHHEPMVRYSYDATQTIRFGNLTPAKSLPQYSAPDPELAHMDGHFTVLMGIH
jgi:hypothetical protein